MRTNPEELMNRVEAKHDELIDSQECSRPSQSEQIMALQAENLSLKKQAKTT